MRPRQGSDWNRRHGWIRKNKAVLEEFFKDCQWKPGWERVQIKGEKVYLVPELPAKLNGIHFLRNGLYLGDLKKNRFEPSQQLAMTLKASDYAGSVSLSPEDERIGRYLRGETLLLGTGGGDQRERLDPGLCGSVCTRVGKTCERSAEE